MDEYSEMNIYECKLRQLVNELNSYYNRGRCPGTPSRSKDDRSHRKCKDDRYSTKNDKYSRSCCCVHEDTGTDDTGTDSDCVEDSMSALYARLKQLERIEKELKKREIELKEKELRDRLNGLKLQIVKQGLCKKTSLQSIQSKSTKKDIKEVKKSSLKTNNKSSKSIKKKSGTICECKKRNSKLDLIKNSVESIGCNIKDSLSDMFTKKSPSKAASPVNSKTDLSEKATKSGGPCECMKVKVSFKTACCSTGSSLCIPIPKSSKKKQKKEKKGKSKGKWKRMLCTWYGLDRTSWSPCRCTAQQELSLEQMMQDAYGDCFPMALRGDHEIRMYDRPNSSKKSPHHVWYQNLWLSVVRICCSPCLICFLCCFTCCNPAGNRQTYNYEPRKVESIYPPYQPPDVLL